MVTPEFMPESLLAIESTQEQLASMPIIIALVDRQEHYLAASREYAKLVDKPLEQIVGNTVNSVVGASSYQRLIRNEIKRCLSGHPVEYELESLNPETGRVISIRYHPRFDSKGDVSEFLMLGLDITNHRRLTTNRSDQPQEYKLNLDNVSQLRLRDERAIQSDRLQAERLAALGRASALVSHELRNPLGAMAASLKLLSLHEENNTEVKTIVDRLWHNLGRCERLVSSMLDFSKPIKIDRQLVQPNVLIEQALHDMALPPHVALDWTPEKCGSAELDVDLITRALTNLMDNAVDAMTPPIDNKTPMRLLIRCEEEANFLKLKISDTGCGMDQDIANRLFEAFFSTKVYGIGIGAVFAHNVVTAHQGHISVTSNTNLGTQVLITLPLKANTTDAGSKPPSEAI